MKQIDVGENIMQALSALADKIGTTTEQVWPWMVKQAQLEAGIFIFLWVIVLALSVCGLKKCVAYLQSSDYRHDEMAITGAVFTGVATLVLIVMMVVEGPVVISKIFNPEYAALKSLMGMIR